MKNKRLSYKKPMTHIFAKEIFFIIASYIHDPATFRSLALVCNKSAGACRMLSELKKVEFSKKVMLNKIGMRTIFSELPNKRKHGLYVQLYNNGVVRKKGLYIDGHMEGYWEWRHYTGNISRTGFYDKSSQKHENLKFCGSSYKK